MFACGLDRTRKGFREPRAAPGTCFYAEFALSGAKKQVALLCKTQRLEVNGTFTQLQPPRLSPHMHQLLKTLWTPSTEKLLRGDGHPRHLRRECRWFTAEKEQGVQFAPEFAANRGCTLAGREERHGGRREGREGVLRDRVRRLRRPCLPARRTVWTTRCACVPRRASRGRCAHARFCAPTPDAASAGCPAMPYAKRRKTGARAETWRLPVLLLGGLAGMLVARCPSGGAGQGW